MKVLVIHDREKVSEEISDVIKSVCENPSIIFANDGVTARNCLEGDHYDLCILDLTLPHVKGRSANSDFHVAESLLEEMLLSTKILVPNSIVGITADLDALRAVQNNIGPHLMAIIEERDGTDWKKQLSDRIEYVKNCTFSRANALLTKYDFDVLIFTALDKELSPYKNLFEITDHPHFDGVKQFVFYDKKNELRKGACFSIGRAGQASAASEAQGFLAQLRPRLAIMTGFCGGIPNKTDLGSILFAEMSIDWDFGKWKPNDEMAKLYSRPEPISIRNTKIHRIARDFEENGVRDKVFLAGNLVSLSNKEISSPSIQLVPFASGSAVIGDLHVVDNIKSINDNIVGVDMESYGFYYACNYPHAAKPEFVCIKSVADACGPEKDDRLHAACCYSSAYVAKEIITEKWDF